MLLLATLSAGAALLPCLAQANFLRSYEDAKTTYLYRDIRGDTVARLSDMTTQWPLDMPPWEFVETVVRAACPHRLACWHRNLQVPATILLADDEVPSRVNVSIVVEGVFNPGKACCTRDNFIRMMGMMLQEMYEPSRLKFLQYTSLDGSTNRTSVVYHPIYTAPKAVGISVGYRTLLQKTWLSLQIETHSLRAGSRNECKYFGDHVAERVRARFKSELRWMRRLRYVKCYWQKSRIEPVFPPKYWSVAEGIIDKDNVRQKRKQEKLERERKERQKIKQDKIEKERKKQERMKQKEKQEEEWQKNHQ